MSKTNAFDVRYDRRVSAQFLSHFEPGGIAASLASYAKSGLLPIDLRFRRDVKTRSEHASLYVGLTSVLDVRHAKSGKLRLKVHETHQQNGKFLPDWGIPMTPDRLATIWPDVELYLDRVIPVAARSHGTREGAVQAAVAAHRSPDRVVLDREVTPSFRDQAFKKKFMDECQHPILDALEKAALGFGGMPKKLGNECDALAIDRSGRLLAIEVKPLGVGSTAWVAAQATMYARILQRWIDSGDTDEGGPTEVLREMAEQRHRVRLAPAGDFTLAADQRVVPVVALQRGASAEMIRRMLEVREVLAEVDLGVAPVEIFEVSLIGELVPLDDSRLPDGRPRALRSYASRSNDSAVRWKLKSRALPDEARVPGLVRARSGEQVQAPYVLPAAYAAHNLLPEVRDEALALFRDLEITWHQGVNGGPTPHLRSSQVQCVNALGQMMADPTRIGRAFGGVLDIESVRDLGEIDPAEKGRFLTFEFVGPRDYFGEGKSGVLTRGAQSTSVDAAFAYRTSGGKDALALVEWKFTETYPSADRDAPSKEPTRRRRYERALLRPDGPIDVDGVEPGDLFHEPLYQLVRQQVLARELERDPDVAAEVVTVVHVLSPENTAYQRSYVSPSLRGRGVTVSEVWRSLLRRPEAFVSLDPVIFLDPHITSDEYHSRYAAD
ncbi:PGN_0703 family putative restriction endonuclease [Nocardioides sediminis]|uniref:PGN_0703 family putative restriction endonuclease n=1 Tax=Nocardioides sediminis TaxID=433648 RepID=UPI00131ED989|nr:hypothetical protein [Nocardioides sediminis]